jgi:hypothetical protein
MSALGRRRTSPMAGSAPDDSATGEVEMGKLAVAVAEPGRWLWRVLVRLVISASPATNSGLPPTAIGVAAVPILW